jgi:hypothetical protein
MESDRAYLSKEIAEKLKDIDLRGRSLDVVVAATLYLVGKCPSNSDKPLKYSEVFNRYKQAHPNGIRMRTFYDTILYLKECGISTCQITPEIILQTRKESVCTTCNLTPQEFEEISMVSNIIFKKPEVKKMLMGKDPYSFTAGIFYYLGKTRYPNKVTQAQLALSFASTEVSIRSTVSRLADIWDSKLLVPSNWVKDKVVK